MKILLRVATSPNLKDNGDILDELLMTESWQTLITFAQETVHEFFCSIVYVLVADRLSYSRVPPIDLGTNDFSTDV